MSGRLGSASSAAKTNVRILLAHHGVRPGSFAFLPSVLARSGHAVDAVMFRGNAAGRSSHLAETYFTEADDDAWVDLIESRLRGGSYGFLVVADEPGLKVLHASRHLRRIEPWLSFGCGHALTATVGHKEAFYAWCGQAGLPVPPTRSLGSPAEVETAFLEMGGPCFVKGDTGAAGNTVFPLRSAAEAAALAARLKPAKRWMIQRAEPGRVGCCLFFAGQGRVLAWFGVRQRICLTRGLGPTVVGSPDVDPKLYGLCERFAAAAGVTGLTAFDYVEAADGSLKLIDSHLGRSVAMNHFARRYGVDFGQAIGRWLAGERGFRLDPQITPASPAALIKLPEFLILAGQIGLRPFWPYLNRRSYLPWWPPGDARVMAEIVIRLFFSKCGRLGRKGGRRIEGFLYMRRAWFRRVFANPGR